MEHKKSIEQLERELAAANERIAALEAREQELTDFIENAVIGLHWVAEDGRILWANQAELDLLGYTREEYIGHHIAEFHADNKTITDMLQRLTANESLHSYESNLKCKDGTVKTVLISSNVLWKDGKFIHTRCFTRDISERKKLELHLQEQTRIAEEANRIKDEFLATVSHELRTPLTAMLGWVRLLRTSNLDESAAAKALETIERNVKSQAQLIEDLLDISRIVSGKLQIASNPVEVESIISSAIDAVRLSAQVKNIRIRTVIDVLSGRVLGDDQRLQQVIWNLLSNAIKFTPQDGHIDIELTRRGTSVEIVVKDNGEGIEPAFLPIIFNRFAQADSSNTRVHKGLGLGLAIVKHIVELHGGTTEVFSKGKGQGTTFIVRLPMVIAPLNIEVFEHKSVPVGSDQIFPCYSDLVGLRILIVDDEPDTLEMARIIFAECKAEVKTANSVAEALAIFDQWMPNVLVSDIGLPGRNGYDLIREIRARTPENGGNILAVALTAYARVEDRMKALDAGFQMHVPKPIEPEELVTIVAGLTNIINRADSASQR